jgi:hypothetical protein
MMRVQQQKLVAKWQPQLHHAVSIRLNFVCFTLWLAIAACIVSCAATYNDITQHVSWLVFKCPLYASASCFICWLLSAVAAGC